MAGRALTDVDELQSGPLSYLVSFDQDDGRPGMQNFSLNLLLAASAFHVLAILFYLVTRCRNLIKPCSRAPTGMIAKGKPASLLRAACA